jgi:hypothetical protein
MGRAVLHQGLLKFDNLWLTVKRNKLTGCGPVEGLGDDRAALDQVAYFKN